MPESKTDGYLWDIENPEGYANVMGRYRTRKELEFLLAHVVGERLSILDLGGGSGRHAVPLAQRGHDLSIVDISEDALRLLRQRSPASISTHCGDFLTQTFNNPFDLVVGIESIQYFTSVTLEELFARVHSVLRPGGRFVFTELNSHSWRYALRELRRSSRETKYNVAGAGGYRKALQNAGFELLSMEGFMWMPLTVSSNSRGVPLFESIERVLGLSHWIGQSPWLLVAARRPH